MAQANAIMVQTHTGSDDIRISFEIEDGSLHSYDLPQIGALSLLSELQAKISTKNLTPISHDSLRPGKAILVQGHTFVPLPSGGLRIELVAEFEDRVVIVPFEIPPVSVAEMFSKLGKLVSANEGGTRQ
jgi:hypothetical protein